MKRAVAKAEAEEKASLLIMVVEGALVDTANPKNSPASSMVYGLRELQLMTTKIYLIVVGGDLDHFFTNLRWKRRAAPHIPSVLM